MQRCGSGMFIPDPDFYPSRISDPGSNNSTTRGGVKFFLTYTIFSIHKYHKNCKWFLFWTGKEIFFAKTLRIIVLFTQNFVIKLKSMGLGSGIRKKTYSGSWVKKGTGSQLRIRNPAYLYIPWLLGSLGRRRAREQVRFVRCRAQPLLQWRIPSSYRPACTQEVTSSTRVLSLVLWIRIRI